MEVNVSKNRLVILGGRPLDVVWPKWPRFVDAGLALANVSAVLNSNRWSGCGRFYMEAVAAMRRFTSIQHPIIVNSGTSALQVALEALDIGPGDEVIVPDLTWPGTAIAVADAGARPVLVDVESESLCMDAAAVERAINRNTRAILPVHLYGVLADMKALTALASKHGLLVIEDCSHCLGSYFDGQPAGSFGDCAGASLQESKPVTCGEGGVVLCGNYDVFERAQELAYAGYHLNRDGRLIVEGVGSSLRTSEFTCAVLAAFMNSQADLIRDQIDANVRFVDIEVEKVPGVIAVKKGRSPQRQTLYGYVLRWDAEIYQGIRPAVLRKALEAELGLYIDRTYPPLHRHPLYRLDRRARYRRNFDTTLTGSGWAAAEFAFEQCAVIFHSALSAELGFVERIPTALQRIYEQRDALRKFRFEDLS